MAVRRSVSEAIPLWWGGFRIPGQRPPTTRSARLTPSHRTYNPATRPNPPTKDRAQSKSTAGTETRRHPPLTRQILLCSPG